MSLSGIDYVDAILGLLETLCNMSIVNTSPRWSERRSLLSAFLACKACLFSVKHTTSFTSRDPHLTLSDRARHNDADLGCVVRVGQDGDDVDISRWITSEIKQVGLLTISKIFRSVEL